MFFRFLIILVLWFLTLPVRAEHAVTLLVVDQKPASREFVEAFEKSLGRLASGVSVKEVKSLDEAQDGQQKVIVAVGSQAFQQGLQKSRRTPVFAALIPRLSYERILAQVPGGAASSAVFLDQPEDRQFLLLSQLPGSPANVGVIRSTNAGVSYSRLRTSAQKFKVRLVEEAVGSERDLATAIQNLTGQAEVILATPDPDVFNAQTIQGILLSAYRARIPLVGFSPAYTRSGALVSLHSSVAQLAEQTAEMIRALIVSGQLPAPQGPRQFEISINRQVARSLGLDLPAESAMVEAIRAKERGQ